MEAVVGIGNELKGDDGFAFFVLKELERQGSEKMLLWGGNSPEGVLHKLRGKKIEKLWIVDAAEFGGKAGEITETEKLPDKIVLSTHSTSIEQFVRYIKEEIEIPEVRLLLVQAKSIEFGDEMSEEVRKAVEEAVSIIQKA